MYFIRLAFIQIIMTAVLLMNFTLQAKENEMLQSNKSQYGKISFLLRKEILKSYNEKRSHPDILKNEFKQYFNEKNYKFIDEIFKTNKNPLPEITYQPSLNTYSFNLNGKLVSFAIKNVHTTGFTMVVDEKVFEVKNSETLEDIAKKVTSALAPKTTSAEKMIDLFIPKASAQYATEGKIATAIYGLGLGIILASSFVELALMAAPTVLLAGGCWVYEKLNALYNKNDQQCREDLASIQANPNIWKSTKTFEDLKKMLVDSNKKFSSDDVATMNRGLQISCTDFLEKNIGMTCKSDSSIDETCRAARQYESCVNEINNFLDTKKISQTSRDSGKQIEKDNRNMNPKQPAQAIKK